MTMKGARQGRLISTTLNHTKESDHSPGNSLLVIARPVSTFKFPEQKAKRRAEMCLSLRLETDMKRYCYLRILPIN